MKPFVDERAPVESDGEPPEPFKKRLLRFIGWIVWIVGFIGWIVLIIVLQTLIRWLI